MERLGSPHIAYQRSTSGSKIYPPVGVGLERCHVRILTPGDGFPQEYIDLRTQIFVEETKLAEEPFYANDACCSHLLMYEDEDLVGGLAFGAAEDTDFNDYAQVHPAKIKNAVFATRGMVRPDRRGQGIYFGLTYIALSLYRRQGRKRLVAYSELGNVASKSVMDHTPVQGSRRRNVGGYEVECLEADIDYVMWKLFDKLPPEMRRFVIQEVAGEEISYYAKAKIQEFYKCPFVNAVMSKTLTKQQYIEVMSNTYCYVQWTTRILSRLLCQVNESDFFKEISSHLIEEVGHPEMVINDIRQCGGSEEYIKFVTCGMVGNSRIDAFMAIQESATAFRGDPVSFLGVPIAIEGISAFMPATFTQSLKELAASWGIPEPQKACTFLLSHHVFDNPNNGHWARIIGLLREHITTERQVRQVRNYIDNVVENVATGYSASLDGPLS